MEDIVETNVDDVIHDDIEENITLKEILSNLAEATSYDQISIFNLSGNHIWEGTQSQKFCSFHPVAKSFLPKAYIVNYKDYWKRWKVI